MPNSNDQTKAPTNMPPNVALAIIVGTAFVALIGLRRGFLSVNTG